jgi:hypothetical protein
MRAVKTGIDDSWRKNGYPPFTVPPDGDFVKDTLLRRAA